MRAALPKLRVLVVEDERDIAALILINLRHHGFEAISVENGEAAQAELDARLPDLILLDWMLPGLQDGLALARKWRAAPRTKGVPIIMLTAKSEESNKVAGLLTGVDDYVTKPFSTQELVARIRAILRRCAPERLAERIAIGPLSLDAGEFRVLYREQPIRLGPTEFRLLYYLMQHPDRLYSRTQLLDSVWGDHVFIEERTVDVHIKRLRDALGDAGEMIETVRGAGYRLSAKKPS
jgi:two-component system phosphate regulon response regulator PhoB